MILFSLNKYQKSCVLGIFNWQGRQSVDFADFWDFNYCTLTWKQHTEASHQFILVYGLNCIPSGLIMTVLNQDNNSQNFIIRDQHQISIQLLQGAK